MSYINKINICCLIPPTHDEMKKLNDNFIKLKTDLIPIIRLLKDSKPLPTPTLDPGPAASMDAPHIFVTPSFGA